MGERQQKIFYWLGWAVLLAGGAAGVVLYFWPWSVSMPCLFLRYTGFYCPGCGGTRAFCSMLKGEFLKSLHYHPVVLYGTVVYAWFMLTNTLELLSKGRWKIGMEFRSRYLYIAAALIILHFIWSNIRLHVLGSPL